MYERVEKRLTQALLSLTLRKAVGLIVAVATSLAIAAALLERVLEPEVFNSFPHALWFSIRPSPRSGTATSFPRAAPGASSPVH
jgi:hypothetical protein